MERLESLLKDNLTTDYEHIISIGVPGTNSDVLALSQVVIWKWEWQLFVYFMCYEGKYAV